jgi:type IV pilus assembly protein PilN
MTRINLLPWREERQKDQRQQFIFLFVLGFIATVALAMSIHLYLAAELHEDVKINALLQTQIDTVDNTIILLSAVKEEKNDLLARLAIIHALQTNRVELVNMFNNFAGVLPSGIYITEIKKKGGIIMLRGRARSNQQISILMKNIDQSPSFFTPALTEITDNHSDKKTKNTPLDELYPLGFSLEIRSEIQANTHDVTEPALKNEGSSSTNEHNDESK